MAWRSPRVVVASLVALAVLLILLDVRGPGSLDGLRGAAGAVAGPPQRALAWVRTQATDHLGGAAAERARIAELERELARVRAEAGAAAADRLTEEQRRALAARAPARGFAAVPGQVVSASAIQDSSRGLAIATNAAAGVEPGQAVMAAEGLAGIVQVVSPGLATVRLTVDTETRLAARVAGSAEIGVLSGTGDGGRFELLDPLGSMAVGDLVVTLGDAHGKIPADLPVGRISRIDGSAVALTRVAHVVPVVDDSTLSGVMVLVPEREQVPR